MKQLKEKYGHFIGGEWVEPNNNEYFESFNPSTGEKLAEIARGNKEDVHRAVKSAEQGFQAWSALKPHVRGQILLKYAHLLREHAEELGSLDSLQMGRPLDASIGTIEVAARYLEYMGGYADKIFGEIIPTSAEQMAYTVREPYGVAGAIIPWNGPAMSTAKYVATALTAGNSLVIKTAESASISPLRMAQLAIDAGIPPGVFNVVTGFGQEAGAALVDHPGIRIISFTGSVQTGKSIMRAAAERIVPVTLELGGKSPNIVFEDADLNAAVKGSLNAFIMNTGQNCIAGTRLFVHRSIKDEFVEKLIEEAKKVKIERASENPTIGPIASKGQLDKILHYIELGKKEGATLAYGGKRLVEGELSKGYFVEPAIFTDVNNTMRIAREEIFGPVVSVIPFDSEEEAIALGNDSEFGLAAGIWTENIKRAHRVSNQLQAGTVYVNKYLDSSVEVPFGGYKASGIGRDRGIQAILHLTQVKTILVGMQEEGQ